MSTQSVPEDGLTDARLRELVHGRGRLIRLAHRLPGTSTDAEDVVQETYPRWYSLSREQQEAIESLGGWLTTVASRICLDTLRSARARRETCVGDWLPEPVPDRAAWSGGQAGAATADPVDRVTLDESVDLAFLVVVESMTPAERVAFMLHDVFRYPFRDVAQIVGRSPAACRQLATSARRRARRPSSAHTPAVVRPELVTALKRAWAARDLDALLGLLSVECP
jgi:RNA polymerase sigma-70 factor (ECF subfamily)